MATAPDSMSFVVGDSSPMGTKREDELDLSTAPGYQLFFSCFLGDVYLRVDDIDFGTRVGWVATLTFALGFVTRVAELPETRRVTIEFQEADSWISMLLDGENVYVAASYAKGIGVLPYERLLRISRDALVRLVDNLVARYPGLGENPAFRVQVDAALGVSN
jgi:hypothetical protein